MQYPTPDESADAAGLRYVSDSTPGITRHRAGRGWWYRNANGERITDKRVKQRIAALAIPPAWTDVWIAPTANAHLQATGRDARGRKQYRYHPDWTSVRDEAKYQHMTAFGTALPAIRTRVESDLRRHGLPREKVLAAITLLLESSLIRIGNDQYTRENNSFGLTTLRDRHATIDGSTLTFTYIGKSGIKHSVKLRDRRLANIVRKCQDLPGQQLFQYLDDDGSRQTVGSADVNAYLREISGEDFTAKSFRTWAGTVLAAEALAELGPATDERSAKSNVVRAIEQVAVRLGNTPAVCRKCYVHPVIIEAYLDGETVSLPRSQGSNGAREATLTPLERSVLTFLKKRSVSA